MKTNGGVIAMKDATVSTRVEYRVITETEESCKR